MVEEQKKTKIEELEKNKGFDNLIGTITNVALPETTSTGKQVQECILEDDTGQVKLKLWDPYINKFKQGDKILIENCWVREFPVDSGDLQVTPSKLDKYKVLVIPPPEKKNLKTFNPYEEIDKEDYEEEDMEDENDD